MGSIPPLPDSNHFVCTLGEALIRNSTQSSTNRYETINEFLDFQAENYGDNIALAIPEEPLKSNNGPEGDSTGESSSSNEFETDIDHTNWEIQFYGFRDLRDCSLKLASKLYDPASGCENTVRGVRNTTVALMGRSDQGFLFMWLALMRLGFSVMVIMPKTSSEAVQHLCKTLNIDTLFFDIGLQGEVGQEMEFTKSFSTTLRMQGYRKAHLMYLISNSPDILGTEEIPYFATRCEITGQSIAYFHHTSGTTGLPKPVSYTHYAACKALPVFDGRKSLTFTTTPLFTGGIADCLRAWTSTSTICLAPHHANFFTSKSIIRYFSQLQEEYKVIESPPKSMYFSCVPNIAQTLSQDERGLEFLRTMSIVGVGGATLPKKDGDFLVSQNINLVSRLGSAECSFLLCSHRQYSKDKEWEYFRLMDGVPYLKFQPLHDDSNRFQLVVMKGWPQFGKTNRRDGNFATGDLFEPHPSIKNAWKHVGRIDGLITLVSGKKFDPVRTEEDIKRFPLIDDAYIFGNGRMYPGAIIIKSKEADGMDDEFVRDTIWPHIEDLNNKGPTHSKIFKDMLVMRPKNERLEKTGKGTTKRQWAEEYYDFYIKDAYESDAAIAKPFSGEVSLDLVMDVVKKAIGTAEELKYDSDFREHHVDSVQATRIRSCLNSAFANASDEKPFPWNLVYQCGSVRALTEYINASRNGFMLNDKKNEVHRMNNMIEQYVNGKSLKDYTTDMCDSFEGFPQETIMLTGVTGTLGVNMVSYLRSELSKQKSLRIICLVRAKNDHEADRRVREVLRYHGIYPEGRISTTAQLECRAVRLENPNLGLSRKVLRDYRQHVTTIIHAAWEVNFYIPVKDFDTQLRGLRNLINFSLSSNVPKHLVFCSSTASVCNNTIDVTTANQIVESMDRNPLHAGSLGYSQSKWVAEAICSLACQRTRANISIIRIGQLSGNTVNGTWNEKEAWPLMLSTGGPGCLNSLPELDLPLSWLPVDTAAKAIIEIALRDKCPHPLQPPTMAHEAAVFHLVNDSTEVTWKHLLKWIGYEHKTVEFGKWLQRAELQSPQGLEDDHPARSLLGFWKDMEKSNQEDTKTKPSFGLWKTRQVSATMREFTDIDQEYAIKVWAWVQSVAQKWEDEKNTKSKKKVSFSSVEDEAISGIVAKENGKPKKEVAVSSDEEEMAGPATLFHVSMRDKVRF